MANERLILTENAAKMAESIEEKDSNVVLDQLQKVFTKLLEGFEVKWLGQQIDDLKIKEQAGTLATKDKSLLLQLTKVFSAKKGEVALETDELFNNIKSGKTLAARTKARAIVNRFSKDDLEYLTDSSKVAEVLKIANVVVDAGSAISASDVVSKSESAAVAGAIVSAEKRQREIVGQRLERPLLSEADEIVVKVQRAETRLTYRESLEFAKKSEIGDVRVQLKESVSPGQDRKEIYWRALGGRQNDVSRNVAKMLIEEGDTEIRQIINKGALTPEQADFLLDTVNNLDNIEVKLAKTRYRKMSEKLDPTLRARKQSKIKVGKVEVLRFTGSRRKRLERIIPLLDGTRDDAENIKVIMQAVSPGGHITHTSSPEYIEANNIWQEYKEWQTKFGEFEKGIDQLKNNAEARYQKEVYGNGDQSDSKSGPREQKVMWTTMKDYIVGHNKDGSPVYSPEGSAVIELMKDLPMRLDENGRLIPETLEQYVGRMNREKRGPSMPGRERSELEALKSQMNPEAFRAEVKKRVVDSIKGIFSTGDSSRAPNNQPISWQLNDDLSMLDKAADGDFRDLWMARLSSYDANIFMGTVENYDDFAKVASFLPREYLSILWEDKIELGNFTDVSGNKVHFTLDSQGLRTTLSDAAPGKTRDEIWLAQILDTDDMWGKYQGLRQLMAFKLAEQIGVRVEYRADGSFMINPADIDKANFVTAEGQKVSLMQLVGLHDNGTAMSPESLEYQKIEDYDLYKEWGFFLNQPLVDMDLNLDSVELERGGSKKGKWRNLSNGLRKVHGAAMNDYLKWKHMGMPIGRDDGDSYWRSFLAWKLLDKNEQGTMTFLEPLRIKLAENGVTGETQKKFFELFEHVVYMPERWKIQSVSGTKSGGLKSVAEIRHMNSNEYANLHQYFQAFNSAGGSAFNWGEILKMMGVENAVSMTGEAGFQMFLKNFDLNRMINRKGLSHNLWFDFVKYTGTSSEYWKALTQEVVHPGDPKLHGQLATIIEGYLGDLKEVKAKELMVRHGRYAQSDLEGYDTFVDEKGKEDTVPWKATSAHEIADAQKFGYRVLSDGRVVDENGRRVYRKGHFGFLKDVLNPFAKKGWGSPYGRRNFGSESWKRRRELLHKQLNSGLMSPEAWEVENRRFQVELFLGIKLDWNKPVSMAEIMNKIRQKPTSVLWIPYTLIRGLVVNSPVELGDLFAFLEPLNKEVGRQFSK